MAVESPLIRDNLSAVRVGGGSTVKDVCSGAAIFVFPRQDDDLRNGRNRYAASRSWCGFAVCSNTDERGGGGGAARASASQRVIVALRQVGERGGSRCGLRTA